VPAPIGVGRGQSTRLAVYRPASSAVGMYQITDGNVCRSKAHCIRDHVVVEDGPWKDWGFVLVQTTCTCGDSRHSIELTSAYLAGPSCARWSTITYQRNAAPEKGARRVIHLCERAPGTSLPSSFKAE